MSDVSKVTSPQPSVLPGPPGPDAPVDATWPTPPPPRLRLALSALGTGVVAALVVPEVGFGVNVLLVAVLIAASVLLTVRKRHGSEEARPSRFAIGLTAIALALSAVAGLRSSEWLVIVCLLGSAGLGAAVALGARRWTSVLGSGLLMMEATIRAMPWVGVTVLQRRPRRLPFEASVVTGLSLGTVCALVVGGLLASADATFAAVLEQAGSWLVPDVPRADVLIAQVFVLMVVTLIVLALGFAASSTLKQPPRKPSHRPPAEWLLPLVLVTGTIAAFLLVDAAELFAAGRAPGPGSHAERAREGFGQLAVVTGLVLLLIAWAGRSAAERYRRHLALAGGTLLALTLLLAFSALRRLWLYMAEYGWTVTRFNAGAFELWLVVLLVIVGVAWSARRTDLLPRLAAGSAGLGLLAIALAGPDAVVAAADVRRYQETGRIDSAYLSQLSPDAVPALRKLPADRQLCALPADNHEHPWYAWNLSRSRAGDLPRTRPFCTGG